jgi:16S rRNA processing protein RimM
MKLHLHCDFPEQFRNGATFFTSKNTNITLRDVNLKKGTIKIDSITTPEDAKKYTNAKIFTTKERTRQECHLDDGEYFFFDLEGCEVFENQTKLGIVDEVQRIASTNYLHVKTDKKLTDKKLPKKFLIPFCKPFALKTDIEAKTIFVDGGMDILEAS